jgi:hypothetical protein
MTKSRNRKNHKAKLASRKMRIQQEKKKIENMKKNFIMELIKKEQENGMFDNIPTIDSIDEDLSINDRPLI